MENQELKVQENQSLTMEEHEGKIQAIIAEYEEKIAIINEQDEKRYSELLFSYNETINSSCWKITKPIRLVLNRIRKVCKVKSLFYKVNHSIKVYGLKYTVLRVVNYIKRTETRIERKSVIIEDIHKYDKYILENDVIKYDDNFTVSKVQIVDILIPVYNGYEYFSKLFESLQKTDMKYRLLIVDDCSPDERVYPYLQSIQDTIPNTVLLKNDKNLGFVQTVNKMFKMSENNVVILNTDVEVPEKWLERLMAPIFANERIATSTPFTNAGTICSFPAIGIDNKLIEGLNVNQMDSVFRGVEPQYHEMPTGVGFCMGISKKALDEVGFFDAEAFSKGYGEENDLCQRAIQAGFSNVMVENLFVYHKHGGSFLSEEKKRLCEKNLQIINSRYPQYALEVQKYFEKDYEKSLRELLHIMLLSKYEKYREVKLFFTHCYTGGAVSYLNNTIKAEIDKGNLCLRVEYNVNEKIWDVFCLHEEFKYEFKLKEFTNLIKLLDITGLNNIIINELVTYPNVIEILKNIIEIKNKYDASLKMLVHDFFAICPSYILLDDKDEFCRVPQDMGRCEKCLEYLNNREGGQCHNITQWRNSWESMLLQCDDIVAFSNDSAKWMYKAYPTLKDIKIVPHQVDYITPMKKFAKKTSTLNIAVLGAINLQKGERIIHEMLREISENNLDVKIVVIGYTAGVYKDKNYIVTGKYDVQDIHSIIESHDIDVFLIPSIWPETFSYTTEEIMKLDMPLACFDIGAPAERVQKYEKGLIIGEIDARQALNDIMNWVK